MKVDGQLYRAQLECRTSDLANTITGAIWYRTDTSAVKMSTGSGYITMNFDTVDNSTLQTSANVMSIKDGGIMNAKINSSAAIAYSKLALSNSITSSDIYSGANIAGSQLSSSAGIVNGQLAAGTLTGSRMSGSIDMPTAMTVNGKYPVVASTNPSTALKIIRGIINASAGTVNGEGFSASGPSGNYFTITFSNAFASAPTVVACQYVTSIITPPPACSIYSVSVGSCVIQAEDTAYGISFIAIGPI